MQEKLIHSEIQPIALLGDGSFSMDAPTKSEFNPPIQDLSTSVARFCAEIEDVEHFEVQMMHIRFADHAEVLQGFRPVGEEPTPQYKTFGSATDYGAAIGLALAELDEHRAAIQSSGFAVNQPWIVFISDGKANANTNPGFEVELLSRIEADKLVFIPVAVGGNEALEEMAKLSPKLAPIVVDSEDADSVSLKEFFRWLSDSVQSGSIRPSDLRDGPHVD